MKITHLFWIYVAPKPFWICAQSYERHFVKQGLEMIREKGFGILISKIFIFWSFRYSFRFIFSS